MTKKLDFDYKHNPQLRTFYLKNDKNEWKQGKRKDSFILEKLKELCQAVDEMRAVNE